MRAAEIAGAWHFRYAGAVLIAALVLGGGTRQAIWTDQVLQILMLPALFYGLAGIAQTRISTASRVFVGLLLAVIALQFLPVYRPGETLGDQIIGAGWGFWTPMPGASLNAALFAAAISGFALYLARFSDQELVRLLRFVLLGFFLHLVIGVVQLSFDQRAVLTGIWPFALRAGLFTNENHFATLIFTVIPLFAWFYLVRVKRPGIYCFVVAVIIAFQLANGSRAGVGISLGLSIVSFIWLRAPRTSFAAKCMTLAAVSPGLVLAAWLLFPYGAWRTDQRWEYLGPVMAAIRDHWPAGSGLGTFVTTYPVYEARETIDRTFANHAHNDWLEITLELGLAGIGLVAFFIVLVLRHAGRTMLTQAAFLAVAAIAAHSLIDYPLRTMGIAVPFAYLTAIILASKPYQAKRQEEPVPLERPLKDGERPAISRTALRGSVLSSRHTRPGAI